MFTVRASSVQATRHVALNRPARAQRSVAMRAGKVRRSREDGARGTATRGDEGRDRAVSISSPEMGPVRVETDLWN